MKNLRTAPAGTRSMLPPRAAARRRATLGCLILLTSFPLLAPRCRPILQTQLAASGLAGPIFLTAPPGDPRLFVVERAGRIRIVENGTVLATPFLDIRTQVSTIGETGLLGLAFAPDYATSGTFYVYFVDLENDSVLARFQVDAADPDRADAASQEEVLKVVQPDTTNHKGGTIAFSPVDGYLYWALGDGGGGNDPNRFAQRGDTLLGKMLRLDVSGGPGTTYTVPPDNPFVGDPDVLDEIWALGFRNPFRWSFDRTAGDIWIGDVGQGTREEVDFEAAGDPGGRNYGWRVHEGSTCHLPDAGNPCEDPASPVRFTFPVYEYDTHVDGTCAITGGVLYRGSSPVLEGVYLFADYCSDRVWGLVDGEAVDFTAALQPAQGGPLDAIVAFGEDGFGEVYLVSITRGNVYRIRP